mmetsp:Transcript_27891/g.24674  ORF Transcript_27891/g.24674 Transcript_27891/m.24674 type:complete len:217 (+) Transcript_27891:347-997(+)
MEASIKRCQLTSGCHTTSDINTAVLGQKVSIALTSYFFNVENYEIPIEVTMKNDFEFALIPGWTLEKHVKIKVNEAFDSTSFWNPFTSSTYLYYSVDDVIDVIQPENTNEELMRIKVMVDKSYVKTQRNVYTIHDMLGNIGGFMGIIVPFFGILANLFSSTMFKMILVSNFYKVNNEKYDENQNIQNRRRRYTSRAHFNRGDSKNSESEEIKQTHF